jgi:hypothetical protein
VTRPTMSLPGRHPSRGFSSRNVSPRLIENASTATTTSVAQGIGSATSANRTMSFGFPVGISAFIFRLIRRTSRPRGGVANGRSMLCATALQSIAEREWGGEEGT